MFRHRRALGLRRARLQRDARGPHATIEIGEEVASKVVETQARAAVDAPSRDAVPDGVGVFDDRIGQRGRCRVADARRQVCAFTNPPAVVASPATRGLVIDLFPGPLPDVSDDHRPGTADVRIVKAESPRIPPAERPDQVASRRRRTRQPRPRHQFKEGIVRGSGAISQGLHSHCVVPANC